MVGFREDNHLAAGSDNKDKAIILAPDATLFRDAFPFFALWVEGRRLVQQAERHCRTVERDEAVMHGQKGCLPSPCWRW
jgi:hypothetical protein